MSTMYEKADPIQPRIASPAPAYSAGYPDVKNQAPYALNHHPFPPMSSGEEFEEKHGVTSQDVVFPFTNEFQAQPIKYNNEKNGYI